MINGASGEQSFLGTGWAFPPSFVQGGSQVDMVSGVEDIQQSLQIIFSTRLGERVMQDTFGCALDDVLFEEFDQKLANAINGMISDAILYHEPRIALDKVDVSLSSSTEGLLLISIEYTVRSINSRFNMVYPFFINEANVPGK